MRIAEDLSGIKRCRILFFAGVFLLLLVLPAMHAGASYPHEDLGGGFYRNWDGSTVYEGTNPAVSHSPAGITALTEGMFYSNKTVQTLIVPASVTEVEEGAVRSCPNLRTIVFQGNTTVRGYGIYSCPALLYIDFQGYARLEDWSVEFCSSLKYILFRGQASLGNNWFAGNNSLSDITTQQGSEAWFWARKNGIPVTSNPNPSLQYQNLKLLKGDQGSIRVYNCTEQLTWSSSSPKVASVDASTGFIKANKTGKAVITAASGSVVLRCTIRVSKKTVPNRLKAIKSNKDVRKSTETFEKIKREHDWLIENVNYDYNNYLRGKLPRSVYTSRGALLNKKAVCDGYARAFKKMMKSLKIPCVRVSGKGDGESHAWNMVKLGGKWYHVDVTWDDPIINGSASNTTPYYDYFLKSSDYMRSHGHSWKTSRYPSCKSTKYDSYEG